jgi:hypothetical protein
MAVVTPRPEMLSVKKDETGDFHAVYIEEDGDDSINTHHGEDDGEDSLPQISSVESIDPTQFLQEEMFVEEDRFVYK